MLDSGKLETVFSARGSLEEEQKRARVAAVYNIFAFVLLIVFLMVYPRLNKVDSLHPGNGGNPGFSAYDLDKNMRLVFYPAVAGWILIGMWLANLGIRVRKLLYYKQRTFFTISETAKDVF